MRWQSPEPTYKWQSPTLNTYESSDHCHVCKFIDGDRSESVMVEVIVLLDAQLAAAKEFERNLMKVLVAQAESLKDRS